MIKKDMTIFGIDLFGLSNKYLVYNLISRNLKIKYRQSYLGIFWTVLVPAASALVYWSVFQFIMKVQIENYLLFLLSGLMCWTFFSNALIGGMESIVGNHGLLNKIPISPLVFPFSEVLTSFVNFLFSVPVLIVVFLITRAPISWALIELPFLLFLLFIQAYSFAVFLSLGFVYFRDLRHIMAIVIQMWMYLTPILYSFEMLPKSFQFMIYVNPIAYLFHGIHMILMKGQWITPQSLMLSVSWTLILLLSSMGLYKYFYKVLVERI